jgi:hypothetical protein
MSLRKLCVFLFVNCIFIFRIANILIVASYAMKYSEFFFVIRKVLAYTPPTIHVSYGPAPTSNAYTINEPAHRRSMYLSLVRSHLSYASEIWAPQSCRMDLKLLESVQRRATRFILNCSNDHHVRPNYKSHLITLNLLPISYWWSVVTYALFTSI